MRKTIATLAIAALGVLSAAGPAASPAQPVAQASWSCIKAKTPGGTKCLSVGEYCSHKPGYAAAYKKAGFKCKANGRLAYR